MNILYVASTCSKEKYAEYVESKGARVSQQSQKYNLLLAQGLSENGVNVRVISTRPINRALTKKIWFKSERELNNNIDFHYAPFINYPVFRNICICAAVFFKILFANFKKKDTAIVCDALNIGASISVVLASAIRGYKTVAIVTDVPGNLSYASQMTLNQRINLFWMRRFKNYLLLTEPMSGIVNPHNRPYVVLEGHADIDMKSVMNHLENKADKKICLYAGSLSRQNRCSGSHIFHIL